MTDMTEIPDEAEFVIEILKSAGKLTKLTTTQIEEAIKAQGIACNDAASRFLPSLRQQGYIKGEYKNKSWHWWVD